jgi:nitrate/nitrite transport system ATP-binding protein
MNSNIDSDDAVLEVKGLRRTFGKVLAVDGVDLTVPRGKIYGFLGINGAGKTTTIRMIMGVTSPDAGIIRLVGETSRSVSVKQRQRIGYVSQEQNFYPWMTCAGIGKFVGSFYPSWDAVEFARILEVFSLPHDRKVSQLSGGMKQRVGIARAFAIQPKMLLLDEPFGALDALTRGNIQDELVTIVRQTKQTVFMITHDVDEAILLSDKIFLMSNGPRAKLAEIVSNPLPRDRTRATMHHDPKFYEVRNHLIDFLVHRSKTFAQA